MPEFPKSLREVFDQVSLNNIIGRLSRNKKYDPSSDSISFDPMDFSYNGVDYVIDGEWVSVNEVIEHASSSCRVCNSKGYSITEIAKNKLLNPQDYVILSTEPINEMNEEMKKLWIEKEKKKNTWRIMMPCQCAIKRLLKEDESAIAVGDGNLLMRIKYKVK